MMKMNKKNNSIGVFDSGIGGLNVLEHLMTDFPNENFIYLADTLNCPYGTKNQTEISQIVMKNIKYFEKLNVKAIVIACNTATANSYEIKSNIPIIRIIEPTAQEALKKGQRIAVLATNYTINARAYNRFLGNQMIGICASELVDLAEEGKQNTSEAMLAIEKLLTPIIDQIDVLVLGCTHFVLFKDLIQKITKNVQIVDSCECLSPSLLEILNKELLKKDCEKREIVIQCTGNPNNIKIDWFNYSYGEIKKVIID